MRMIGRRVAFLVAMWACAAHGATFFQYTSQPGDFSYRFTDTSHAQFNFRIGDNSGSVPIAREPF